MSGSKDTAKHYEVAEFDLSVAKHGNEYVATVSCGTHEWIGRGETAGDAIERIKVIDPPKTECPLCTKIRRSKGVTAAIARG